MQKSDESLVYIVLVNYHTESDTIECIQSMREKLTYKNYRVVVVDNSKDEKSFNILKAADLGDAILIKSEQNNGFAAGCNIGIVEAQKDKADYVLLLNNDTIIKSNDLIEQLLAGFKTGKVGMTGGKIFYYDYPEDVWYAGGYVSKIRLRAKNRVNIEGIVNTPFITGCMQMIKMSVIEQIGLMNEDYFLCYEDNDYCERIHKAGYQTVYNSDAQIYHKCSKSNPPSSPTSIYYSNRARYIYMKRFHLGNQLALMDFWVELYIKKLFYKGERKEAIQKVFRVIREGLDYGITESR